MSFGPERAGRQQASSGSPAARIARRILLTGGCAVAGWLGASMLGAAAHAATPQHAASVDSVLSSVTGHLTSHGSHDLAGLDGVLPGTARLAGGHLPTKLTTSVHHTVASVLHQRRSITVHRAPSLDASAGSALDALDSSDLTGSVEHQVTDRVGQLDPVTKPVTQSIKPVMRSIRPVTQSVTPVASTIVKPITDVAHTATKPLGQMTTPTTDLSVPVGGITNTVQRSLTTTTDAISLPGVTALTSPLTHLTAPIALPGLNSEAGPLVRWAGAPRATAAAHMTIRQHVTAHRRTAAHTAGARRATGAAATIIDRTAAAATVIGARAVHLPVRRHPAAPLGPLAPPVPFGVAGGSAPSPTAGSGAAGGSAPAALGSDADAPVQALGTVDPTAASMARSVAKRPSTSPD